MAKYKAILIGNGTMGKRHRDRFESCGVVFTKVIDADDTLEESDLLSKDAPDFVVVASPASTHYEFAKRCLENHVPVLVEKPLATTAEQAYELVRLSLENNTLLFVAHSECYNPLFLNFRKHFLADLKTVVAGDVQNQTDHEQTTVGNVRLEFRREHGFTVRCRDVGVSLDLLVHDLSLFLTLFRYASIKVINYSVLKDDDAARMTLQVQDGEFAGLVGDFYVDRNSERDVRTISADFGDFYYTMSLARYQDDGSVSHTPNSLDNEHRFFMKLLAGACKEWGDRAMENAAQSVALATTFAERV